MVVATNLNRGNLYVNVICLMSFILFLMWDLKLNFNHILTFQDYIWELRCSESLQATSQEIFKLKETGNCDTHVIIAVFVFYLNMTSIHTRSLIILQIS